MIFKTIRICMQNNSLTLFNIFLYFIMVPGTGLEPVRRYRRQILSLLCLPIPSPGLRGRLSCTIADTVKMEARVGIEPALTELQSAA